LRASEIGLVVDATYETCGPARSIAYELSHASGKIVHAMGLEERSPGAHRHLDNPTPTAVRIAEKIQLLLSKSESA
jgi:hypothetical protein